LADQLLLISQRPEDIAFATVVAKTAGLQFTAAKDVAEGIKIIGGEAPKATLVDATNESMCRAFEDGIHESVGLFSEAINPNALHYISDQTIENVPYLTQSPLFGHLILRRFENSSESAEHYGRTVKATLQPKSFGLQTLMKPGTKIQSLKLVSSDQKQSAVDAIKNYIIAAKFQSRIASLVSNAIDEILMNAIFDAPADELGKQLYISTPRSTVFKLEGKAEVEMHVGFDGTHVGITAIDRFGSLDKAKLLAHVTKVYTEEEYKIKTSQAGAGIGLATVYRTGGSFFFASESRERTEVTVFFRRTDSYREFRDQFRFFSTQFYF
jgi:hypothetical protein